LFYQRSKKDTIVALSTPWGKSGIGIIRLSGPEAVTITDSIFRNPSGKKISSSENWKILYGKIYESGKIIDDAIILIMKSPFSYTKEDVIEISAHGGPFILRKIIELCIKKGARLAEPGEFTKRAYLNGRIDLTQAEAVAQLINAESELQIKVARKQLEGELKIKIKHLKTELLNVLAGIETIIEFPEEDIKINIKKIKIKLLKIKKDIKKLLNTYSTGKFITDGTMCVITGKPNVGKSSLLNILTEEERAIVTEIPGTTRDIIKEKIFIKGIPFYFIDTAGLRKKIPGKIERLGIKKTIEAINKSDFIIFMIEANKRITEDDLKILNEIKNKDFGIVLNKIDLGNKVKLNKEIKKRAKFLIATSCKTKQGIKNLKDKLFSLYQSAKISCIPTIITSTRQKELLEKTLNFLENALSEMDRKEDITSFYLREAAKNLSFITGENITEELLNTIFSNFCIGK